MEANGWIINVDQSQAIFNDTCEPSRNPENANTWYGWAAYDAIGNATLFMKGHGSARLVYGNCHPFGTVKLYLNSVVISQAGPEEIKEVYFDYEHNAVLKLEEDRGIIKIHSLIWNCSSKIFFILKASLQIIMNISIQNQNKLRGFILVFISFQNPLRGRVYHQAPCYHQCHHVRLMRWIVINISLHCVTHQIRGLCPLKQ